MSIFRFAIIVVFVVISQSCSSRKDLVLLQNDSVNQEKVNNNYQLFFKPDDLLQITVSSQDLISVQPFNIPVASFSTMTNSVVGQPVLQNYLIDQNGEIEFPVLGTLKLGGLTRMEGIELIRSKLYPEYVKDPIININITNFKISIHGDVRTPGTFSISNERFSIFDAIGLANGLNISARRDNVLLIREAGNNKIQYRLDLKSNKVLTSPAFYLQQNDVIYIEPNRAKIQDASFNRSTGLFISLASLLVSLIAVLSR